MDLRSSDEALRRDIPSFIEPRPPLIHHPFMRPRPEKGINLLEKFEEDSDVEEPELVQVYLRMKPCKVPNNLYDLRSDKCLVASLDTTTAGHGRRTQHNVSKMYTFSRIFKPECKQKEIFDQVMKDNLKRLIDGHSFTLLTYGASGSGKTFTVMGTVNSPGLVPRSLEYLFKLVDAAQTPIFKPSDNGTDQLTHMQQDTEIQWVKRLRQISAPYRDRYRRMSAQLNSDLTVSSVDLTNRTKHYVWVSFVEIYNEAIYDLLASPDKRVKLRLREDSSGHVYVKGVTQAFVRSGEEAYDVMFAGKHNLVVAATGVHANSSRSHCIFTITMLTETDGEIRTSHVRLCDLAGCERQRTARNTGARMLESKAINSSLHVLERCLHMLRRKQLTKETAMVPYRECKLTRLLGSGLSGARGEAVTMVVTVNPAPQYAHETRHVLSLAVVAKDIQINNTIDPTVTMSSLECIEDSTMQENNHEIMKLRTENERLHFELLQAQSCIAQLRKSMEEKQQQSANTMMELVEDTEDMMREFYEKQLTRLRSQMKEMEVDYESRLAEMAKEMNVRKTSHLEEKMTGEKLGLELNEIDINHLHQPIEERDAIECEEKERQNIEPAYSTDSDNESDSDSEHLDESLEPVNQLRKSILYNKISEKKEAVIDLINESSEGESGSEESENCITNNEFLYNENKSKDLNNSVTISKESLNAAGDDDSEAENQSGAVDNAIDSITNFTLPAVITYYKNSTFELESDKNYVQDTFSENNKSECEEMFNISTKLDKTQDVTDQDVVNPQDVSYDKDVMAANLRGTYFVRNEPHEECNDDQKFKTLNTLRGTYFVADREMSFYKETDIEKDHIKKPMESSSNNDKAPTVFVMPKQVSETLVSKLMKSFKTRQSSASSLRQFEQLESAVNNADKLTDVAEDIEITIPIPTQIMKKKTYFDDTTKEIPDTTEDNKPTKILNDCGKSDDNQKFKYFESIPDESMLCQLSTAAKTQEKRLLFDSPEISSISTEKQDESGNLKTDMTVHSPILTPKILKEAKLYYTKNDTVTHHDVLISRSPSIVRDDITQEYKPSVALKKVLGESFTKPEIISSARKDRLASKKQESVDIFDSPLSSITKASFQERTSNKNAEEPKNNINTEISPVPNVKEMVGEIAHEFIESLVASQKIKSYIQQEQNIKEEIKDDFLEITSFTEKSTKDNIHTKDGLNKVHDIEIKYQLLNDTQTSKGNNTVDEFDNIVKDLTNMRATEFEALVSEADTSASNSITVPANITPTKELTEDNLKENEQRAERRKKFEEAKYNLRRKGHSHLNISDEKSDKATEQVAEGSKSKSTIKRCLRLRRRKNIDEVNPEDNENKLKDIINLKKEFSDVTMGLPPLKKDVPDIPSPEKKSEEDENVPPMLGIQSCPSKSVTRSRRKLFTPRAEPLEESPSQAGDSNERLYVPRPSYHRARARRKL